VAASGEIQFASAMELSVTRVRDADDLAQPKRRVRLLSDVPIRAGAPIVAITSLNPSGLARVDGYLILQVVLAEGEPKAPIGQALQLEQTGSAQVV
jgi:hypothetical protein